VELVPLAAAVKFIGCLYLTICHPASNRKDKQHADEEEADEEPVVTDPALVTAVMQVLLVMWRQILPELRKEV
jgi:hypothetical protein